MCSHIVFAKIWVSFGKTIQTLHTDVDQNNLDAGIMLHFIPLQHV